MSKTKETKRKDAFEALYKIIEKLRSPGGCPWDIKQTPKTLRETLIEECFETVDAINEGKPSHVCEEIGDVLLNAVLLAYLYEETGDFSVVDSLEIVTKKLIRRHPHVFGQTEGFAGPESDKKTNTSEEVLEQWEKIKSNVEGRKSKSVLDSVSLGMPSLHRAYKLQKKAAKLGFDWQSFDGVMQKTEEEINELKTAVANQCSTSIEEEIGDLLFSVVNLSRFLNINPSLALASANKKFTKRFKYVEQSMKKNAVPMDQNHLKEMDEFWEKAKIKLENN